MIYDDDYEPTFCDYGHRYHGARCGRCEADYQAGVQDVERERLNVMVYGEEGAAAEELARYLRYGE